MLQVNASPLLLLVVLEALALAAEAFGPSHFVSIPAGTCSRPKNMAPLLRMGASYEEQLEAARLASERAGNSGWKRTEGTMQSTDVGDFVPENYEGKDELDFTTGLVGISGLSGGPGGAQVGEHNKDPSRPGLDFANDSMGLNMADGLEECDVELQDCIPEGMEFKPASVPDGSIDMAVSIIGAGTAHTLEIKPFCMGFEDYFAGFAQGSHPAFRVAPNAGRMDRRGGETTFLEVICDPRGHAVQDLYEATLVVKLPEENEALTYTVKAVLDRV